MSLYEEIGGAEAVTASVDLFYDKVLADPLLTPFFDGVDTAGQRRKQKAFFTLLFRGDAEAVDDYMRRSHKHLVDEKGLSDVHFDAVAGHLHATLDELSVRPELTAQVMATAGALKGAILNR